MKKSIIIISLLCFGLAIFAGYDIYDKKKTEALVKDLSEKQTLDMSKKFGLSSKQVEQVKKINLEINTRKEEVFLNEKDIGLKKIKLIDLRKEHVKKVRSILNSMQSVLLDSLEMNKVKRDRLR